MNRADSQTRALSKLGLSNVTQESPLTSNLRAYEINLVEQMLKKKIVQDLSKKTSDLQNSQSKAPHTMLMKQRIAECVKPSDPDISNFASELQATESNSLLG